jgi:predicted Rossmann fold flavoprotein
MRQRRWCTISIMETRDVVILGAGAAGLMCAVEAGKRGRSVTVLDHAGRTGSKILASGGGRCNFSNLRIDSSHYLSENPHFCKSAISRFTPEDFTALLLKHAISYCEKQEGQLFCRRNSRQVVGMLETECVAAGVELRLNCRIIKIEKRDRFLIFGENAGLASRSLVLATGGLSFPSLGASGLGYRIAKRFGLRITPLSPALVPFIFSAEDAVFFRELSGLSLTASVRCRDKVFRGQTLFTHQGLSGPVILQISSYWRRGDELVIDLFPDIDVFDLLQQEMRSKLEMHNFLSKHLPRRFSKAFCARYCPSRPLYDYTTKELREWADLLRGWTLTPAGTAGYEKAEVTRGGIDTRELSSKTMESEKVPGLYCVGEVVDVTGWLGGYNLHWAWASGYVAGQYV